MKKTGFWALMLGSAMFALTGRGVEPELITVSPAATAQPAFGDSAAGEISADGRFVLFESSASDVSETATPGGIINLFLADRQANTVRLVSANSAGTGGANGHSVDAAFSADMRYIVYQSSASNLTDEDTDAFTDIFLWDRTMASMRRLSAPYTMTDAGPRGDSRNPSISADGARIVFESAAQDLDPTVRGTRIPLFFLHDQAAGTNRAIWSVSLGANYTTNTTANTFISSDGKSVFFEANARDLITGGATFGTHVYVYDLETDTPRLLSGNVREILGRTPTTRCDSLLRGASVDGSVVIFVTAGVPSGGSGTNYLFRHVVAENFTEIVATNIIRSATAKTAFADAAMSADGNFVAYAAGGNLYRWNAITKARELVTASLTGSASAPATAVSQPIMTADGRYIAFTSTAADLVGDEPAAFAQLYRRDMDLGVTIRVSADGPAAPFSSAPIYDGSMSDDGQTIVFSSAEPGFSNGNTQGGLQALAWNATASPPISMISKRQAGLETKEPYRFLSVSTQPMSANGKIVAFSGQLQSVELRPQVWLRDRATAKTTLVSFQAANEAAAVGYSRNAMVSADGQWVAFESNAANLSAGATDSNGFFDVFLFGVQNKQNRLVTRITAEPTAAPLVSELKAMSPNGRYLAIASANIGFTSPALTNLTAGSEPTLFLWDRDAGTFRTLTLNTPRMGVRGSHSNIVFSPDSKYIALIARGQVTYTDARTGQPATAASATTSTLLIHEIETGLTKGYAPIVATKQGAISFSQDGTKLVTTALGTVAQPSITRIDLATGAEESFLIGDGRAVQVESSGNSDFVAFTSEAAVAVFPPRTTVAFLDFSTDQTNRVSLPGDMSARRVEISPSGEVIVFASQTDSVEAGDLNRYPDVYVFDKSTATAAPLTNGNGPSVGHVLSADGSTVLLLSDANNLTPGDLNNSMDLFAYAVASAPTLSVKFDGNFLELRWPRAAAEFHVETAIEIGAQPSGWDPAGEPVLDGEFNLLRLATPDAARFFHLRR